ncbi:MAG TPA: hypothetical protein VL966_08960 [Alphaproteobacteria bacterium]|jgi:hypothetical protein|nr:hypothetical protein [Alphaproteobacteria bacterium]
MSARPQPLLRLPRSFARQAALLLALAAAFLPALIPGLHAGHGMLIPAPVAQVTHSAAGHHAVALGHHHVHSSGHDHAMGPRSEPSKVPTPPSKRPDGGMCPICRTMQQLAAWTVPDGTVIAAPVAVVVDHAVPRVGAPTLPPSHTPSQPRAPPVAA